MTETDWLILKITALTIVLMIVGRWVNLWYWRIDEGIAELKEINKQLKAIRGLIDKEEPDAFPLINPEKKP